MNLKMEKENSVTFKNESSDADSTVIKEKKITKLKSPKKTPKLEETPAPKEENSEEHEVEFLVEEPKIVQTPEILPAKPEPILPPYYKNISGYVHYISDLKIQFSINECKDLSKIDPHKLSNSNDLKISQSKNLVKQLTFEEYEKESKKPFVIRR